MSLKQDSLSVIDLMTNRHHHLKKLAKHLWEKTSMDPISNSELFILTKISEVEQTTIANISKQVDISRQATHKFISRLKEKNLVEVGSLAHNKKEKAISISPLGKKYVQMNEQIKAQLEHKISITLGPERLRMLKEILNADWGL